MDFEFGPLAFGATRMRERDDMRQKLNAIANDSLAGKTLPELEQIGNWLDAEKNPQLKKFLFESDDAKPWQGGAIAAGIAAILIAPVALAFPVLAPLAPLLWIGGMFTAVGAGGFILIDAYGEKRANAELHSFTKTRLDFFFAQGSSSRKSCARSRESFFLSVPEAKIRPSRAVGFSA